MIAQIEMYSQVSGAGQFLYSAICQLGIYSVAANVHLGNPKPSEVSSNITAPPTRTTNAAQFGITSWLNYKRGSPRNES